MPVNICETITEYNAPMQSARCQWKHQKKKANTFECSFTSCLKANKPITLFQRALKQVRINGVLFGTLNCNPHPNSARLIGAIRLLASSEALFFLTSLDLRRHSESLFYRLYFSVLCNVNSCWLSTWQSKLQGWSSQQYYRPIALFLLRELLA